MRHQTDDLTKLRQEIDNIDQQLLQLINQRAKRAQTIGEIKKTGTDTEKTVIFRPEREAQILQQLVEKNQGPLNPQQISDIFRSIFAVGRSLQRSISVAFLGPAGTFSHSASFNYFGKEATLLPQSSMNDIVKATLQEKTEYGVIPIENSTEGVVNSSLDALAGVPLIACGEIILPIRHHLLINPKHQQLAIKRMYSHSQSLAQCQHWLSSNFPAAELIAVASNAKAAELASKEAGSAAIAGDLAAEFYGLTKYKENIQDLAENSTRFLIIGKQNTPPSGHDKTSLFVGIVNKPSALAYIIEPFSKKQINITLPVSRPSGKEKWQYIFYLEIDGHQEDEKVKQALAELQQHVTSLQILGSYPKALS